MKRLVQRILASRFADLTASAQERKGFLLSLGVAMVLACVVSPWGQAFWRTQRASGAADEQADRNREVMAEVGRIKQQMRGALRQEDWRLVVRLGKQIIERHDIDGQVWRWMGAAFLQLGDYQHAEMAWQQALRDPVFRSASLYGLACAQSMQGKKRLALENLEESLALGFASPTQVLAEQAFFSLRGERHFDRMIEGESSWLVSQNQN